MNIELTLTSVVMATLYYALYLSSGFVYIKSGSGTGKSLPIVQAFEESNEKSLPAKC